MKFTYYQNRHFEKVGSSFGSHTIQFKTSCHEIQFESHSLLSTYKWKCLPKGRPKIYYFLMFLWIPNTHQNFGNTLNLSQLVLFILMKHSATNEYICTYYYKKLIKILGISTKVRIFWEGHKILWNLDVYSTYRQK